MRNRFLYCVEKYPLETVLTLAILIVFLSLPFVIKEKPKKVLNKTIELNSQKECKTINISLRCSQQESKRITIELE